MSSLSPEVLSTCGYVTVGITIRCYGRVDGSSFSFSFSFKAQDPPSSFQNAQTPCGEYPRRHRYRKNKARQWIRTASSRHISKRPGLLAHFRMLVDVQQALQTTELARRRFPRHLLPATVEVARSGHFL